MVATTQSAQANIFLVRQRAKQLKSWRELVMSQLYPAGAITPPPAAADPVVREAVVTLANTFSRYAQTQKTSYEDLRPTRTSATSTTNLLERQVSNAIAQVLGRSPGSSPTSFISALKDAFPTSNDGKVSFTPSRSAVSLYSQNGYTPTMTGEMSAGLVGQLSAEQAALYRQASVIVADAIKVLAGLQPFVPEAEMDKVDALRAMIQSEIKMLVDEFGRIDEPRADRVNTYFNQLKGSNGHLTQFGERAFLDRRLAIPTTVEDEAQIAGFELLKNYVGILSNIWNNYQGTASSPKSLNYPEFSLRLSRASVLLPVIAEGNANFMSALDSIGFTETERRSSASRFTTLGKSQPGLPLPDITVNDLNEWIDRFASLEGPANLADSGQYGLEFVTDQAHDLFKVFVPIVAFIRTTNQSNLNRLPIVAQALLHERVSWALDDLNNQLNALADLAA
jgi:hypothetical protein